MSSLNRFLYRLNHKVDGSAPCTNIIYKQVGKWVLIYYYTVPRCQEDFFL